MKADLEIEARKALLRAPNVMIWMTNEEHRCVYCNEAMLQHFGHQDLLGDAWLELIHPEDLERMRENQRQLLASPLFGFYRQEYRSKRPDGNYVSMLDISFPRFDEGGAFLGYIGSAVDITRQKLQEERHRREPVVERQALDISDREKLRLGKGLREDICQGLNGLALKAMLLERKLKGRLTPAAEIASEIRSDLHRLAFRTKEISQSLFPALALDEDFAVVVQDLAERAQAHFGARVSCHLDLRGMATNSERNLHLYRIIEEAVTNALRHGRARHVEIHLAANAEGKGALEIRDDGRGFPAAAESPEGLGLKVMEYRAKLIGGELHIQAGPKGGTSVRCLF
ncbi:MAG TPA: PAS domain S-box protein [bacterium]|nr:PAS domain S-box protein [bacterium]